MYERIKKVCDAIAKKDGKKLLRLLSKVYYGERSVHCAPRDVVDQAVNLGLVTIQKDRLILTASGFCAGNVAKEYCNWVDNGRHVYAECSPPAELVSGKNVLDLGCSFGRWLWEFQKTARSVTGLELQKEYIELGKALAHREGIPFPDIRQGSAEDLDLYIPAGSIDLVFSRLVLNDVDIKKTLRKITDVLVPGGIAWIGVESFSKSFRLALEALKKGKRFKSILFRIFGAVNSIVCMLTGHQIKLKIPGRMHKEHKPAYPPLSFWRSACASAGLKNFHLVYKSRDAYIFWVRKI